MTPHQIAALLKVLEAQLGSMVVQMSVLTVQLQSAISERDTLAAEVVKLKEKPEKKLKAV